MDRANVLDPVIDPIPVGPGLESHGGLAYDAHEMRALMLSEGFVASQRQADERHKRRVVEAARLLVDVSQGRIDPYFFREAWHPTNRYAALQLMEQYPLIFAERPNIAHPSYSVGLRETMSTSDYSALTVDVLDRMLYGYYTAAPITNLPLVKKHPLRDFRVVARYEMDSATRPFSRLTGGAGAGPNDFPSLIPHGTAEPPTQRAMDQAAREVLGPTQRVTYQPQLYQGMMSVNWRALVNDDLGIFQDMTQRLAISGNRTLYAFITSLYAATTGWNTTLVSSTFANGVTIANGAATNNPALSFQGLQDAYNIIERQTDSDGQPITFQGTLYLVYGPSLHPIAMNLIKAIQADLSVQGGVTNAQGFPSQRLRVEKWVAGTLVPIQDKYLRLICTTSGTRDTMWALVYDPNSQNRPGLELGQLTGYETPQLYQKVPNTMRVGGGVDPMLGDFYSMNQDYKGLLVMGGTQIDGRSWAASTGQGV
jgi:hypothetical protein